MADKGFMSPTEEAVDEMVPEEEGGLAVPSSGRRNSTMTMADLGAALVRNRHSMTVPTPLRAHTHYLGSAQARRASRSASRSPHVAGGQAGTVSRLSVDLPPDMQRRLTGRRRAVEFSDHKAVVLLHSRLKGMKLGDVA
ncbi:hypothetical protein HDE_01410 [Halotydeus destructor]|nr:hypothetical protein HDE_01410 [Halotydeus destructor]